MKSKRLLCCALATLVIVLTTLMTTAAADRFSGRWRLNTLKSKFNPGPAPTDLTLVIESDDNNYKLDATGTDGSGKPLHEEYSAKFDGRDYPVTGSADADSVSVKRIDADTIETYEKKNGTVVLAILSKVSKDGKTRTSTWSGKNAEGKAVHNVVVFDKQ
jgi:hypothetical protein